MKLHLAAVCLGLGLMSVGLARADDLESVGLVTATQGTVTMQPATMRGPVPLQANDQVGPLAIFETRAGARCKILYTDDSLLTIGEESRLEVTEQTYRASAGGVSRAFVAHLGRGSVRALVGRTFEGDNSLFEIHSGTAVATARGTYFVVWRGEKPVNSDNPTPQAGGRAQPLAGQDQEGPSGVANIGRSGTVGFTSGGATVLVSPGHYSVASPGEPPTAPKTIDAGGALVASAVSGTVLAERPKVESPRAALAAAGLGAAAAALPLEPRERIGPYIARADALGGQAPSGSYMVPEWPFPVTPVTPPAVVSGAVPITPNATINLSIQLP
jgi:hypothetical protein